MKAFPVVRDLVTDVSTNYRVNRAIPPFRPREPDFPDGTWRMYQDEVDRPQEFRKCIECFLCQDVCHVLRDHGKQEAFMGPAFLVRAATYEGARAGRPGPCWMGSPGTTDTSAP